MEPNLKCQVTANAAAADPAVSKRRTKSVFLGQRSKGNKNKGDSA